MRGSLRLRQGACLLVGSVLFAACTPQAMQPSTIVPTSMPTATRVATAIVHGLPNVGRAPLPNDEIEGVTAYNTQVNLMNRRIRTNYCQDERRVRLLDPVRRARMNHIATAFVDERFALRRLGVEHFETVGRSRNGLA